MPIHKVVGPVRPPAVSAESEATGIPKAKKSIFGRIILVVVLALLAGGFAWSFKGYVEMKKKVADMSSPTAQKDAAKKDMQALLDKVSKLIVLPIGEEPTVATITDVEALKAEQQFYRDAQNGNKVLVYMQEKKAIIYDEQKNILVNVGPIFVNSDASTTQAVAGDKVAE